jgi:hypothetical protein
MCSLLKKKMGYGLNAFLGLNNFTSKRSLVNRCCLWTSPVTGLGEGEIHSEVLRSRETTFIKEK